MAANARYFHPDDLIPGCRYRLHYVTSTGTPAQIDGDFLRMSNMDVGPWGLWLWFTAVDAKGKAYELPIDYQADYQIEEL